MQNKDVKFGKRQSTPEVHPEGGAEAARGETIVWCATHSPLYIRSDTHGGTCIYMHVWCPAQGHSITACPAPRCACSPVLSGETSLGGGQQQSDSGSTAGGGFFFFFFGVVGGRELPTSPWAWHIPDLGRPDSAGGGRSYPPAGCCLKYKATAWPLQLDDKHIIEERKGRRRRRRRKRRKTKQGHTEHFSTRYGKKRAQSKS